MTNSPPADSSSARIAELQAAIRYWDSEAKSGDPDRADLARVQAAKMRDELSKLSSTGVEDAAC